MLNDYLRRILTARVYDVADETPLELAPNLSARYQNRILLKREDLQPVFSFKLRGAYNKMVQLSADELRLGVIAASAGNHAQGVALAAATLGCRALIVMPVTTPRIKVKAVEGRGAEVLLHGESYDEAYAHAVHLAEVEGLTFIHPYDDPDVIAGQGTIGMEIQRQHPAPIHAVFVAVGGGGLISGIAAYLKALRPEVRIVGVEPQDANAMALSLQRGERVRLESVGLFADGVAVKQVGAEPFRLCRELVDEVILVNTDEVCAAIKDVFEDTRSILEPSGALPVAGMKRYLEREGLRDHTMVAVACGANMNFDRLRFVAERAELGEQREALFAATIPEQPGSFRRFCAVIGARQVTEFNYRYAGPGDARVFVGVEVRNRDEYATLLQRLRAEFPQVLDLSDNEMAKLHVRHMVGGRPPLVGGQQSLADERLYRFEFPERPGALMRFLERMSSGWNISLFHYRNHGSDAGRVLVGMQVPGQDDASFAQFLAGLGYTFWDETENPAYALFLR
ncbi:MAG: threonine ammonia-lyase, biosynthetic [Bryobacterales bacterium]|jgi:threonine dehydratase|nr:threonine ammonia-lyase, biosynthetic [Bryobacterales bacterium]